MYPPSLHANNYILWLSSFDIFSNTLKTKVLNIEGRVRNVQGIVQERNNQQTPAPPTSHPLKKSRTPWVLTKSRRSSKEFFRKKFSKT